jgi:putative hydrolase of HD superfamily
MATEFRALWDEFEARETPEAKFARTMDNFQPLQLNDATGGKAWREHEVHVSDVLKRNERTAECSDAIWEYMRSLIQRNVDKGNLKD